MEQIVKEIDSKEPEEEIEKVKMIEKMKVKEKSVEEAKVQNTPTKSDKKLLELVEIIDQKSSNKSPSMFKLRVQRESSDNTSEDPISDCKCSGIIFV